MKENNELTRDDIAIDHDMEVDCDEGREIAVYIETWFDVDRKFHIDTASNVKVKNSEITGIQRYSRATDRT